MKKITFKCNQIKVGINSNNDSLIYDLINKYGDYFEVVNEESDFNISYLVYENPIPLGNSFKEIDESENNYIVSKENNLYIFMQKYDSSKEDFVKRMFTNYYIKVLQSNGFFIIHGACISKNDEAIIISGNKRCGKTTTLINFLNDGYDFIANDRIAVKKANDEFLVLGIPFSMGVLLENALNYPGFDIRGKKISMDGDKKKVYIDSKDVSKIFDVSSKSSGNLKCIINPIYNSEAQSIKVEKSNECAQTLGDNIMFDNAVPEEKSFFNEMIRTKYMNSNIINTVPFYIIEQGPETFDELNKFIKENILNNKVKEYKNDL